MYEESERALVVGDRVVYRDRSDRWHTSTRIGTVLKVTEKGTVTVDFGNYQKVFPRVNKSVEGIWYGDMRLATPRENERARWIDEKPALKRTTISKRDTGAYSVQVWDDHVASITVKDGDTTALREAAVEFLAIAEWIERKPG